MLRFVAWVLVSLSIGACAQAPKSVLNIARNDAAPQGLTESSVLRYTRGPAGPMVAQDIIPVLSTDESYVESWEFRVYHDKYDVKLKFQVANLGFGDFKGRWTGYVQRRNDSTNWDISKSLDQSSWSSAKDHFEIRGGPWSISGEPGHYWLQGVAGDDDEVAFEFELEGEPWRPGTGLILFGGGLTDYMKTQILAVQAKVHGVLRFSEEGNTQVVELEGKGYGYHTAMNLGIHVVADSVYSTRIHEEELFIEWYHYGTTARFDHVGVGFIVVAYQGTILFESSDVQLVPGPSFVDAEHYGYTVSRGVTLVAQDGDSSLRLSLGSDEMKISDPLSSLPALERAVASQFAAPIRYEQTGPWRLDLTVAGERTTVEGTDLYSTALLR